MSDLAARALIAWPLLMSEVLIFGTAAFACAVAPDGGERVALRHALSAVWRGLTLVLLSMSSLALLGVASIMAGTSWRGAIPVVPEVLRATHVGRVWVWRLLVAAALLVAAWWPEPWKARAAALCGLGALLLILGGLSSHAIDRGMLAVAVYFVHEAMAGLWTGALIGLMAGTMRGNLGREWLQRAAPLVSRLAGWCVTVAALTGSYTAYATLGLRANTLLTTACGRTLLLKVALVVVTLSVGGYNRYRLIPTLDAVSARRQLLWTVGSECVLLALVVGVTALLANTPPAR